MKQKALITGATGLLGREVVKAFEGAGFDVTGTGFSRASPPKVLKVDIQNADEVAELFGKVKRRRQTARLLYQNPEGARRLNVTATEQLVKASDAFFIYISTDYVFPGVQGQAPYKSSDEPEPPNIYGQTKLDGERAVLDAGKSAVVLRVPVLYGATEPGDNNKESAVNILMESLQKSQKEKVKMDNWAIRYPTNTEDVGRICADIAKVYTAQDGNALPRILQFSSEDRMTKYQICQKFSEIMGMSMNGLIADEDGGKPGPDGTLRPYDCHLDTAELKSLGIDVGTIDFVAWWRRKVGSYRH